MMPANQTPISFPDKLREAVAADPKRTGVLAGLGLILMLLCFRAMRGGPAIATASRLPSPASLNLPGPAGMSAEQAGSNNALIEWLASPRRLSKRNLFALRLDAYPKDLSGPIPPADSNYSDEAAKSGAPQADQIAVADTLAKQASKLTLQSTFLGPTPMAMVNGQLVREGDNLGLFQVVRIEPRRIAISQNGVTLQISMD
jgi:hypothetical protein